MKMKGQVNKYLEKLISEGEVLHFSLLDPEKLPKDLEKVAQSLYKAGTSAFLIGGTLGVSTDVLESSLDKLEDYPVPKILFPSNVNLLSRKADAILFMSLLNSDDIYYIIGAQVSSSLLVKEMNLETIPSAYLIIGHGGTASHIGRARPIPFENSGLAVAYASAAELLGMKYVYLEAGSGAPETVRPEMIRAVKKHCNVKLIVGGGIKSEEKVRGIVEAGADIIVTGNLIEDNLEKALRLVDVVRSVKKVA